MARRKSPARPAPLPVTVVLDAEAVSSLAATRERGVAKRRAAAVLAVAAATGSRVVIPAPVLAEVARTRARARELEATTGRLTAIPTDRPIAMRAGQLLGAAGRDATSAVDAFVVATAAARRPALILTGDPDDLAALAASVDAVAVRALNDF